MTKVCGKEVEKVKKTGDGPFMKGVIYGIPVEEKLEDLKSNIRGGKVIEIKRLQTRKGGERVDSLSILLVFQERVLPDKVRVGYMSYNVRAYVPPPLRCYKCQKYGHIADGCKGKQKCGKCGGEHEYGKCEDGAEIKCANCGGAHMVTYGGCEVRKRAVEIQQIIRNKDISYADAVKVVQKERRVEKKGKEMEKEHSNEQVMTKSR